MQYLYRNYHHHHVVLLFSKATKHKFSAGAQMTNKVPRVVYRDSY